jgi:hypothetical protein
MPRGPPTDVVGVGAIIIMLMGGILMSLSESAEISKLRRCSSKLAVRYRLRLGF